MTCILLAAGESRRFGSPKPLALVNGLAAIRVIVDTLLASAVDDIVVVIGHEAQAIRSAVPKNKRLRVTVNKDYARGMTSSFQTGLKVRTARDADLMLLPVDLPFVKVATIDLLCRTFKEERPLILVPTYNGRPGHPPVFASSLADDFRALRDGEPLSTVQHRLKGKTRYLPVEDPGVILTYNTPAELARHLQK